MLIRACMDAYNKPPKNRPNGKRKKEKSCIRFLVVLFLGVFIIIILCMDGVYQKIFLLSLTSHSSLPFPKYHPPEPHRPQLTQGDEKKNKTGYAYLFQLFQQATVQIFRPLAMSHGVAGYLVY